MAAESRRPQLPALSYLDMDKDKAKSEDDLYHSRNGTSSAASPLGPPPPYSHSASQANTWATIKSDGQDGYGSRRTSGDEHDDAKLTSRQSLPSISQALGQHLQPSYMPSTTTVAQTSREPAAPSSPSPNFRRPYTTDSTHPHNSYASHSNYQTSSLRHDSGGPQPYHAVDTSKPSQTPSQHARPPLHLQTAQPPTQTERLDRYGPSPQREPSSSQVSSSMGPPNVPYGYTSYSAGYTDPTPPSGQSSGPIYQPSSQYAPPQPSPSRWRTDHAPSRYIPDEPSAQPYGESVKRHLDLYDLEAALNDIASSSGIVLDFSRRYGDRMHQNARSTPTLSTLPSIVEVDDMVNKSRLQLDALNKIRDVIVAQQVAYDQHVADQRQQVKFREPPAPQHVESHAENDDSRGGFGGSETKKRRGRAAPPGRCHSCNRAETPEWRRGPDGARTLCNACGLHYAKLTRKQTNASKTAGAGSSNLRPKES